jgi:hypothetical protein
MAALTAGPGVVRVGWRLSASAGRSGTRPQSRSGFGGGSGVGKRARSSGDGNGGWLASSRLRVAWAWAGPRRPLCTCARVRDGRSFLIIFFLFCLSRPARRPRWRGGAADRLLRPYCCVVEPRAASIALPGVGAALLLPERLIIGAACGLSCLKHAVLHSRNFSPPARLLSPFLFHLSPRSVEHYYWQWHGAAPCLPCSVSEKLCVLWERCRQTARTLRKLTGAPDFCFRLFATR